MPSVDLLDETYLAVDRSLVAPVVAHPAAWRHWWPGLELTVTLDRGLDGVRWDVTGTWIGTSEVWLETWGTGTVLHLYQRLDPAAGPYDLTEPGGARRAARARDRLARAWKRHVWALKDRLEEGSSEAGPASIPRP